MNRLRETGRYDPVKAFLERQGFCGKGKVADAIYVCVPRCTGLSAWRSLEENVKLCRRRGLGVFTVCMSDRLVEVHCDPGPYTPRKSKARQGRLLR